MSRFKVGDRVRIVSGPQNGHKVGDIGVVTELNYRPIASEYDYGVSVGDKISPYDERELELATKTLDGLEKGDVLIDSDGDEATVLHRLDDVLIFSEWDEPDAAGYWRTLTEIKNKGWKIKDAEPEPAVTEITLKEVAKKFGLPVDQVRIKD